MTAWIQKSLLDHFWSPLMDECCVQGTSVRLDAFTALATAYSEPHRCYHDFNHIADMLRTLLTTAASGVDDFHNVEFATWYHDFVYDTRRMDNESRSAEIAGMWLRKLALSENRVARVRELILMTRDHQAPEGDVEANWFLDLDLQILAAARNVYEKYAKAIRREYAWVPDREFYQGRRKILQGFLLRPTIYRSDWFRASESHARANLAAEIAQIDEMLRTLPS